MKTDFDSACCNFWAMTDDSTLILLFLYCKTGKEKKNMCGSSVQMRFCFFNAC